jgi:hypothetical protein
MILEEVNQVFGDARKVILKAYNQALSEGFTPSEAKELLFTTVKNLSRRTVYLYLPDEAKDKKMQSVARGSLQDGHSIASSNGHSIASSNGHSIASSNGDNYKRETLRPLTDELGQAEILIPISNSPGAASQVLLNNEFAISIQKPVSSNVSEGLLSKFVLTHKGHDIISVNDDT